MSGPYDDIISLPHPVSKKHPQMPLIDRAAQFSPFAALTGYEAAVKETARLTGERLELDEYEKEILNGKLQFIAERLPNCPAVSITYFQPDERKAGGVYVTVTGVVKKILAHERVVTMINGTRIPIEEIIGIRGDIFKE